jgi:hypothetical protein
MVSSYQPVGLGVMMVLIPPARKNSFSPEKMRATAPVE